ncbi:MAG: TIGR02281 family clan AA aspartic protease [Hyphomicrobiales bacterium]|nr:TIGR02281 family clan AA aspartic protease [Rickettsiales bacterium]MCP5361205.1 TIGR02281 family clan AA aspartic protease [Hyphomicrobiales bacterium]
MRVPTPVFVLLFILSILLLTGILLWVFPDALHGTQKQELTRKLLWLSILGSAIVLRFRGNMDEFARYGTVWVAVFLVLILGYSYRDTMKNAYQRLRGELLPTTALPGNTENSITLRVADDGHYYADVIVNGIPVRFMVDTGATDITLPRDVANRVGIDTSRLAYTRSYNTADGVVMGAPIMLEHVQLGSITRRDMPASVTDTENTQPLLGMRFLNSLEGYEVRRDTLTLFDQKP